MDFKWIEDFLVLSVLRNFTEASKTRNVSQSAFSRRIKSLELWVGTDLIDRRAYPVTLTAAGEHFLFSAQDIVKKISQVREECRSQSILGKSNVAITALHVLATSFFPSWLRILEADIGTFHILMDANTLNNCLKSFTSGQSELLLIYDHECKALPFDQDAYDYIVVGSDTLLPVSAATRDGFPLHALSYNEAQPTPCLFYAEDCFLGAAVAHIFNSTSSVPAILHCYKNTLSETLKAMTLSGAGISWLPQSCIQQELDRKSLIRLQDGDLCLPLEIRLYRKSGELSKEAEKLWAFVSQRQQESGRHSSKQEIYTISS